MMFWIYVLVGMVFLQLVGFFWLAQNVNEFIQVSIQLMEANDEKRGAIDPAGRRNGEA